MFASINVYANEAKHAAKDEMGKSITRKVYVWQMIITQINVCVLVKSQKL